jgi:hypothetical protein
MPTRGVSERSRAGNARLALDTAAELQRISLADALPLLLVIREDKPSTVWPPGATKPFVNTHPHRCRPPGPMLRRSSSEHVEACQPLWAGRAEVW